MQEECIFAFIHLVQEEGWRPAGDVIVTHTNFFLEQREQDNIISPSDSIVDTIRVRRLDAEDFIGGIRNIGY